MIAIGKAYQERILACAGKIQPMLRAEEQALMSGILAVMQDEDGLSEESLVRLMRMVQTCGGKEGKKRSPEKKDGWRTEGEEPAEMRGDPEKEGRPEMREEAEEKNQEAGEAFLSGERLRLVHMLQYLYGRRNRQQAAERMQLSRRR